MGQDATSFWSEIKKYEDALAKDPSSCCFAPLAELYRKNGLLDEAIDIAKRGVQLHQDYVGGYIALGRACFEKGMREESREALEKVVALTPDNLMAQKLLGQIYIDVGESAAAQKVLRQVLSLNPADMESRVALDALELSTPEPQSQEAMNAPAPAGMEADIREFDFEAPVEMQEELIEEAEILEDLPVYEEEEIYERFAFQDVEETEALSAQVPDKLEAESAPISTGTLAELYISQGFLKRAMRVYRDLLNADPENRELKKRLFDLKLRIDEDNARARKDALNNLSAGEKGISSIPSEPETAAPIAEPPAAEALPATRLMILETWLENIRRRKHVV